MKIRVQNNEGSYKATKKIPNDRSSQMESKEENIFKIFEDEELKRSIPGGTEKQKHLSPNEKMSRQRLKSTSIISHENGEHVGESKKLAKS